MQRIQNPLSALGQARGQANSNHIDSSVQKELGWGAHSFTLGSVTYGSTLRQQSCAVYISEKSIIIMSVSDGDNMLSRMTRHKREEQHWELKISDMRDLQIIKGGDLVVREFSDENKERLRQRCAVQIKKSSHVLYVDTYDSPQFAKHLLSAWYSCSCAKAANLPSVIANSSPLLARDYLHEVISCYGGTRDLREKIEILDEISEEVLYDLELKDAIFRHRELLVLVLSSCHKALNAPSGYEEEVDAKLQQFKSVNTRISPQSSPSESMEKNSGLWSSTQSIKESLGMRASDSDTFLKIKYDQHLQSKLEQTVMNRMHFFHASLRFMMSLFFLSESVGSRTNALTEGDPLSPSAWLEFLAPDLFDLLCRRLHCQMKVRHDKETQEKLNVTVGEAPSPFVSTDFGDMIPPCALVEDDRKHYLVGKLIRSVADYQIMTTVELSRIASMGIQEHKVGMSRTHNRIFLQRTHIPMGDLWIRQANFDVTLESLLTRIASLLDDIVLTERHKRHNNADGIGTSIDSGGRRAKETFPKRQMLNSTLSASQELGITASSLDSPSKSHPTLHRSPSVPPSPGKSGTRGIGFGFPSNGQSINEEYNKTPTRQESKERRRKGSAEDLQPKVDLTGSPQTEFKQKGGKRDSFVMLNHDRKTNVPDVAFNMSGDFKAGVLETQEVLLFYCCQLLRHLTYDSAKAREVLGNECQSLWPPIKVILDIICPRKEKVDKVPSVAPESPRTDIAPKRGIGGFLQQCFGSSALSADHHKENADVDEYRAFDSLNMRLHHQDKVEFGSNDLPWLSISEYGPSRVHINKQAWELLVMSRRAVEECMNVMHLHENVKPDQKGTRVTKTVAADGKIVIKQVLAKPPPRVIELEITPRKNYDAAISTLLSADDAIERGETVVAPTRPPRRPRGGNM